MRRDEIQRQVDAVRAQRSELENHVIDEYRAGYIRRREFIRRGTVVGMSMPLVAFLASACGSGDKEPDQGGAPVSTEDVKKGGTVRAGLQTPGSDLDPIKVNNAGALAVLGQSGEYLIYSDSELKPVPRLAESWKPNRDGSQWTFKIRQGVKYHDGKPMTTEDVAATFNRHADPENGSNALSAFTSVLSKGGAQALDESTVMFELDAPNGNFPFSTSSDNYNMIILPKGFDPPTWSKNFLGTGPWKLEKYTPNVGVTYSKNPDYWDKSRQPLPDRNEIRFYQQEDAAILGIQGDEVDMLVQISTVNGKPLLGDPNVNIIEVRSALHRQMHMRTDKDPFDDKRVRQAVALLVNRENLVRGLLEGKADYGNDSPFAPLYASTDKSVAQREQDVEQAKALLSEAGKAAGIDVKLNITDGASYYGDAVYGKSPWLDSTFGITEYGHRGVPNVLLNAPLKSDGTWNSAHFKNDDYDKLADEYYFLTATKPELTGVQTSATGDFDISQAGPKA